MLKRWQNSLSDRFRSNHIILHVRVHCIFTRPPLTQVVLDNPTSFLNPFQFEITFECLQELDDGMSMLCNGIKFVKAAVCMGVLASILVGALELPTRIRPFVITILVPSQSNLNNPSLSSFYFLLPRAPPLPGCISGTAIATRFHSTFCYMMSTQPMHPHTLAHIHACHAFLLFQIWNGKLFTWGVPTILIRIKCWMKFWWVPFQWD